MNWLYRIWWSWKHRYDPKLPMFEVSFQYDSSDWIELKRDGQDLSQLEVGDVVAADDGIAGVIVGIQKPWHIEVKPHMPETARLRKGITYRYVGKRQLVHRL